MTINDIRVLKALLIVIIISIWGVSYFNKINLDTVRATIKAEVIKATK